MSKRSMQLQAALSLLQYHVANMPHVTTLPEFNQIKQREVALLRSMLHNDNVDAAQDLYIQSIADFDEALQDLTPEDLYQMRADMGRRALTDDFRL